MISAHPRAIVTLALLLALSAPVFAEEDEDPGLPILESGIAAVDLRTQRLSIRYSTTIAGPLVEIRPLIERLGGKLEIGPLGEAHELTLNDQTFAFGPGSKALTYGEEIVDLSQAARAGDNGVQVPLDLLDHIYGNLLGYEFTWNLAARMLMVRHQPSRELGLQFNLVHVQGVTTVVFQFSTRPRYRVHGSGRVVTIELIGDQLADTGLRPPPDDLVTGFELARNGIRLHLAPGTTVENYILDNPFRLVFDVLRGASQRVSNQPEAGPADPRRQRQPGIRTIVLDPGHGGADTGAVSSRGLEEKRLALQLAQTVKRLLEERLPVRVVLTRDRDSEVPLETRAALANQNKGDLFVSLHLNSANGESAHGAETYFLSLDASTDSAAHTAVAQSVGGQDGDPLFDLQLLLWDLAQSRHLANSQTLAKLIQEELNGALELRNRGVKQAPLRVLMGVAMPAVLVEFGFLSNPEEEAKLQDPGYRHELADALVKAISRYRAQVQGLPEQGEEQEAVR